MAESKPCSFLAFLALALVGCGPKADNRRPVTVDLAKLTESFDMPVASLGASTMSLGSTTGSFPAVSLSSQPPNPIAAAWKQANKDQAAALRAESEVAVREPLAALQARLEAETAQRLTDRREQLTREANIELSLFEAALANHADSVGWDRVELAWKAGFPDPDPNSQRKKGDRYGFHALYREDAARLRQTIKEKEATFDLVWRNRIKAGQAAREAQLAQYGDELQRHDAAELELERARLRANVSTTDVQVPMRPLPPGPDQVEVPASSKTVGGISVSVPASGALPVGNSLALVRQRLEIFLDQNNYRLARAGEAGFDMTRDFSKWLRQYELGG